MTAAAAQSLVTTWSVMAARLSAATLESTNRDVMPDADLTALAETHARSEKLEQTSLIAGIRAKIGKYLSQCNYLADAADADGMFLASIDIDDLSFVVSPPGATSVEFPLDLQRNASKKAEENAALLAAWNALVGPGDKVANAPGAAVTDTET